MNLSGSHKYLISKINKTTNRDINKKPKNKFNCEKFLDRQMKLRVNKHPVTNSIKGYSMLILLLHFLHLPFSKNQLIIGILSKIYILFLHEGQKLFGKTTDLDNGNLYMITFKKLPIHVPIMKLSIISFKVIY